MVGVFALSGPMIAAELNSGRDVAQRLVEQPRAAREQAPAVRALLRKGSGWTGLKDRTAAMERHAEALRSLLGGLEASVVLDARRRETLAIARTTGEVLAILRNNEKTLFPADSRRSAREGGTAASAGGRGTGREAGTADPRHGFLKSGSS